MKPFIRKNKNTIQQRRYLESVSGNTWPIRKQNILFIKEITAPRKSNNSEKRAPLILFWAKHCAKESMGSKKQYEFQPKGAHTFFGPNMWQIKAKIKGTHTFFLAKHCVEKSIGSKKKYEFRKRGTHTFFGPNIVSKKVWDPKKKYEFQKKRNSYFFQAKHCVEKNNGTQKKSMSSKKKGTHTFFGPNIVQKISTGCKKKVWVPKKKELILFSGQTLCRKK